MILIDPRIKKAFEKSSNGITREHSVEPLHGGFEAPSVSIPFSQFQGRATVTPKPNTVDQIAQHISLIASLGRNWMSKPPTVMSLGYIPTRIALANFLNYTRLVSRFSKHYEYSLKTLYDRTHDDDLVDLQLWKRRSEQSLQKLGSLSNFITTWGDREEDQKQWKSVLEDIIYLQSQLNMHRETIQQTISITTTMVQLADSRASMAEAASTKQLTLIALIFVPLSWVASLFSMSNEYAPGGDQFWQYFAVSLPLVCLVLALSVFPWRHIGRNIGRLWQKLTKYVEG